MDYGEAIAQLKFDKAMILFDSSTGKALSLEQVKIRNKENYKTYIADCKAIEMMKRLSVIEKDLKYYLDTNEENGVVYIPKFIIEKLLESWDDGGLWKLMKGMKLYGI